MRGDHMLVCSLVAHGSAQAGLAAGISAAKGNTVCGSADGYEAMAGMVLLLTLAAVIISCCHNGAECRAMASQPRLLQLC